MCSRRGKLAEISSTELSRRASQVKRLRTRVRNLQSKLAESVPKTELEALKATFEAKLSDMAKLGRYVPKEQADILRVRSRELEFKLAEYIPKAAEAEARIGELQARLSESKSETDALKEKVAGLESKVAEAARSRIEELEEVPTTKPPTEEKLSEPTPA